MKVIYHAMEFFRQPREVLSFIGPIVPAVLVQQRLYHQYYKKIEDDERGSLIVPYPHLSPSFNTKEQNDNWNEVKNNNNGLLRLKMERKWRFKATALSLALTIPLYGIMVIACRVFAKKYL